MSEIDPDALITASQAAQLCAAAGYPITVAAVCNWVTRGYLKPAQRNGRTVKDGRGRPLYRLLDVARAEAATSKAARRVA